MMGLPHPSSGRTDLKPESRLTYRVALFLKLNFPDEDYRFDGIADVFLKPQTLAKITAMYRHDKSYPDLFIAAPRTYGDRTYHGMYVELKATKSKVFLKDGKTMAKNDHLHNQARKLEVLNNKGYYATFGWADDNHVFELIVGYLMGGNKSY